MKPVECVNCGFDHLVVMETRNVYYAVHGLGPQGEPIISYGEYEDGDGNSDYVMSCPCCGHETQDVFPKEEDDI